MLLVVSFPRVGGALVASSPPVPRVGVNPLGFPPLRGLAGGSPAPFLGAVVRFIVFIISVVVSGVFPLPPFPFWRSGPRSSFSFAPRETAVT